MNQRPLTVQTLLLWLAIVSGACLRFGALGAAPLTDGEAELALQALHIAQGKATVIQGYPLEVITTAAFFFLFGSSNFFARFLAALSGTLLLLGVVSLRPRLGEPLTVVLAFALALDPALIAQSRQMGSVMPALAALAAVFLCFSQAQWRLMGVALGLGVLSGAAFFYGGGLILFALIAFNILEKRFSTSGKFSLWDDLLPTYDQLKQMLLPFLLTIVLTSTLFSLYPPGLGATFSPLIAFLNEWKAAAAVRPFHLLLALGVYQPIATLFGGISLGRGVFNRINEFPFHQKRQRFLGIWFAFAVLLAVVHPARQMSTLIWAIIPLWVIAAQEISLWIEKLEAPAWAPLVLGGITLTLLALFWLQLAAYSSLLPSGAADWLRFASVFSSLVLIALFGWLAEMVWSARLAWQGMLIGVLAALVLYTVSTVWGVAFSVPWSQVYRQELWKPYPQIGDADLLLKTVEDLSRRKSGRADSLPLVLAVDSPALQWLLRTQTQLSILPQDQAFARLSLWQADQLPQLLITPATSENPSFAATYRGQDFNWRYQPNWQNIPLAPLKWLLFRQGTWEVETIILWARSDLFPDGQSSVMNQGEQPIDLPSAKEFPLEQP